MTNRKPWTARRAPGVRTVMVDEFAFDDRAGHENWRTTCAWVLRQSRRLNACTPTVNVSR